MTKGPEAIYLHGPKVVRPYTRLSVAIGPNFVFNCSVFLSFFRWNIGKNREKRIFRRRRPSPFVQPRPPLVGSAPSAPSPLSAQPPYLFQKFQELISFKSCFDFCLINFRGAESHNRWNRCYYLCARVESDERQTTMVDNITLSEHLYKLAVVRSEEEIENLLLLLWRTRKIGLSALQKSSIQSLLKLPLSGDLDPVLAALRLVIRTCVHNNLVGDDALKLFPPDLPLELQNMLLILLQKHHDHWKEEQSQDQHVSGFLHHVDVVRSTPLIPLSSSVVSGSLLPLQVDPNPHFNGPKLGPTPVLAERHVCFPQANLQNDVPPEIQGVLPRVKSMTWTVENRSEMPTHRVAIITLKLQDYTKSPSNETEVKFQLTRDTLEAVLRSMTYINEQLSRFARSSSVPLLKKPRQ